MSAGSRSAALTDGVGMINVISCGTMTMPEYGIRRRGGKSPVQIPVLAYLVSVKDRRMLIDTGCSDASFEDSEAAWGPIGRRYIPAVDPQGSCVDQLRDLGVQPEDISDVVLTHLHMDHAGNTAPFANARIWVQLTELRYALLPGRYDRQGFVDDEIRDLNKNITTVEGDVDLGNGVYLLDTPGHTPGHQSVLVAWPGVAPMLIVGDAVYTRDLYQSEEDPGFAWDIPRYMRSIHRLKFLESAFGARLLFAHDSYGTKYVHEQWPIGV